MCSLRSLARFCHISSFDYFLKIFVLFLHFEKFALNFFEITRRIHLRIWKDDFHKKVKNIHFEMKIYNKSKKNRVALKMILLQIFRLIGLFNWP